MYETVFTHKTADPNNNYEFLEFLGDVTLNKAIAWYLARRFPNLQCAEGVKILTRLKINYISKKAFADFADQLGFWDYISADQEVRDMKKGKTMEDVFEAFFGATEWMIDHRIREGAGARFCYRIIGTLLKPVPISFRYEDLFDAKTRLKEVFDHFSTNKLGKLRYIAKRTDRMFHVTAVRECGPYHQNVIGEGFAPLKADAEQRAAQEAIVKLREIGFVKPLSESFAKFCT